MLLVADESVDSLIINGLRNDGFDIYSISENKAGIDDLEVLKIANKFGSLLITEDKDFGELTYRLRIEHKGILLIRLADISRNERVLFATKIISEHAEKLSNKFSVLNKNGLRIKKNF